MSQSFRRLAISCLLFLALAFSAPAFALTSAWEEAEHVAIRLVSAAAATEGLSALEGGVEIKLADGWHAYWRMPGDGGLAPSLNWEASQNIGDVTLRWPVPKRFEVMGLQSFGYEGSVLLPFSARIKEADAPARLALKAEIMVCKDICIPQAFEIALDIPATGAAGTESETILLQSHQKNLPGTDGPNLRIESTIIGPKALVLRTWSSKGYEGADVFVELSDPSAYIVAKPEIMPDAKDARFATIRVAAPDGIDNLADFTAGMAVTITLRAPHASLEKTIQF